MAKKHRIKAQRRAEALRVHEKQREEYIEKRKNRKRDRSEAEAEGAEPLDLMKNQPSGATSFEYKAPHRSEADETKKKKQKLEEEKTVADSGTKKIFPPAAILLPSGGFALPTPANAPVAPTAAPTSADDAEATTKSRKRKQSRY